MGDVGQGEPQVVMVAVSGEDPVADAGGQVGSDVAHSPICLMGLSVAMTNG